MSRRFSEEGEAFDHAHWLTFRGLAAFAVGGGFLGLPGHQRPYVQHREDGPARPSLKNISVTPLTHTVNWRRDAIDSFPPAGQARTRSLDIPTRDNGEPPEVTGPGVEPPERSPDKGGSLWIH